MHHTTYFKVLAFCGLAFALSFTSLNALAHRLDHNEALQLSQAGEILPAQEILNHALTNKPNSSLLAMSLAQHQGKYYYKLRLISANQEVHHLVYLAQTGELIKESTLTNAQRQHKNKPEKPPFHHQPRKPFKQPEN